METAASAPRKWSKWMPAQRGGWGTLLTNNFIWLAVVGTYFLFVGLDSRMFRVDAILNVASYSAVLAVVTVGEAFVLLTGRFDLSPGAILGFTAIVGAWLMGNTSAASGAHVSPGLTIVIMLAIGALIGLFNGAVILGLGANPFIVTLATLIIFEGLTQVITQAQTIYGLPSSYIWLGSAEINRLPVSALFALGLILVCQLVLWYRRFGRRIYAIGGNEKAAFASGIRVKRVILATFVISGTCGAAGGWLLSGQLDAATAQLGQNLIFDVFAAAVIGGVSLYGGKGSMIGVLGGVLLLGEINTGLALMNVSQFMVESIRGFIILAAVVVDSLIVMRVRRRRTLAGLRAAEKVPETSSGARA
jgi:simple sugar transport system permease protein